MKKYNDFLDVLLALRLPYDDKDNSISKFNGRQVMFVPHSMMLFVGEKDFDRWANSIEYEFDLSTKKGCRAAARWINGE